MRIWIDLSNTPHVLFFEPVCRALRARGHEVTVTLRRFANTLPLAQARGVEAEAIGAGHDADRDLAGKRAAHRQRVEALMAFARGRFDLAVSHVSYTQIDAAQQLGLPSVAAIDYEHPGLADVASVARLMVPSVLPAAALEAYGLSGAVVRHYDGLKEEVYLANFRADPGLRQRLGVAMDQSLVVVRPIADHAVYTDAEREIVQRRLLEHLAAAPGACLLVLPRTAAQARDFEALARRLPALRVLRDMVDGPALIWAADLVVCGGGTMLREAAVLGVPAVSVFSGPLGAVDRWLERQGRVQILRSVADVADVQLRRAAPRRVPPIPPDTLQQIVDGICAPI
jgi:predicted glycosyltransferase